MEALFERACLIEKYLSERRVGATFNRVSIGINPTSKITTGKAMDNLAVIKRKYR